MPLLTPNRVKTLYWKQNYTVLEVADKFSVSIWAVYNFMKKHDINRRGATEANYVTSDRQKPQFKPKARLSFKDKKLKIAGIMLYWAEGTLNGNTVDFVNSNPRMIQIFLRFLREICGISEKRLRIYLYAYSYQDIKILKNYWTKISGVPLSQFTKPYIRKGSLNKSKRKLLYGLVHIRYNDKKLLRLIKGWIEDTVKCDMGRYPSGQRGQTV